MVRAVKGGGVVGGKIEILISASEVENGVEVYATTNVDGKVYSGKKIIPDKTIYDINREREGQEIIFEEWKKDLNK